MHSNVRVCGIIQARDEWPLLALSVTHALLRHADEVYVLDHGSVDGTRDGLRGLSRRWPDRLHVVESHRDEFWQEASLSVLLGLCSASAPDWVYVFDADEFLLQRDPAVGLPQVLASLDKDCVSVRYEVQNWVAPADFDHNRIEDYARLRARSVPGVFVGTPTAVLVEGIRHGTMNYFDVPFQSKVVFRPDAVAWVAAGTHDLKTTRVPAGKEVWTDSFHAAHLPLLSRARLGSRVDHGRRVAVQETSFDIDWQSRLVLDFSRDGRLDEFWKRHSVPQGGVELTETALPVTVDDDSLAEVLEEVVRVLEEEWREETSTLPARSRGDSPAGPSDDVIGLDAAVRVVRDVQLIGDDLRDERDDLLRRNEGLRATCEELHRESDELRATVSDLSREIDECRRDFAAVAQSRSWRLLAPLRGAAKVARRAVRRTQL